MSSKKVLRVTPKHAAIRVLMEAKEPLHVKEITERIINSRLFDIASSKPDMTVSITIYSDIKKNKTASPFKKVAPATFALVEQNLKAEDAELANQMKPGEPVKATPKKAPKVAKEAPKKKFVKDEAYVPRMKSLYDETVVPALLHEFEYSSIMQVPRFVKISVSMGVGGAIQNKKLLESAVTELEQITGQHAVKTKAKKSISNFKLREGMEIGALVTLRGEKMWEFFDRLVSLTLPRVKDFRGVNPKAFDGRGNYSLGIQEQIVFPEIDYDKIEQISGLNITIVTTANTDQEAFALLKHMGMPFRK